MRRLDDNGHVLIILALYCPINMMTETEENTMPKFKAVLIGATGATGKHLLAELVKAKVRIACI